MSNQSKIFIINKAIYTESNLHTDCKLNMGFKYISFLIFKKKLLI